MTGACLPWIKCNKIIITTGETENTLLESISPDFRARINFHTDRAYFCKVRARLAKSGRPVAPGPPKSNKILPFEG